MNDTQTRDGWIALGRAYFEAQRYDAARATLKFASQRFGAHPELDRWLGAAAQKCDDEDTAMRAYARVLEARPDDLQVVVNLAEIYLNTLRIEPAAQLLERALALDPEIKQPAGMRARVLIMKARRAR